MSNTADTEAGPMRAAFNAASAAAAEGAKMALAAEASELIVDALIKLLINGGAISEEQGKNEIIRGVLTLAAPGVILSITKAYPDLIPQSGLVERGAELALTAAVYDVGRPLLGMVTPMLAGLADVGLRAGGGTTTGKTQPIDLIERSRERDREAAEANVLGGRGVGARGGR